MNNNYQGGSVSRLLIQLEFDKKIFINGVLIRFYSPLTISKLVRILPIENKVHYNSDNFIYIETNLIVGSEKSRLTFSKGDIAFLPANNSICIFLKDVKYTSMNLIGKITDIEKLNEVAKKVDSLIIKLDKII